MAARKTRSAQSEKEACGNHRLFCSGRSLCRTTGGGSMSPYRILSLMCLGSWLLASTAQAQFGISIVEDPMNLVQNTSTAASTLATVSEMQKSVEEQVTHIAQDAKHLVALPMDMVAKVQDVMGQYNNMLATVKGVGYTVSGLQQQWDALYGSLGKGSLPQ